MYNFTPIGTLTSCFKEKFGIPRQPGLVPAARANLVLHPPFTAHEALSGLEAFSHIWLVYIFHGIKSGKWKPTVRPPRLGGNRRTGVFATRSNFRPNPIGISAVRLDKVVPDGEKTHLELSGVDLLDGTPVLDIKPYLPYADAIAGAKGGFAPTAPEARLSIEFTAEARIACEQLESGSAPGIKHLIRQMLTLDPRPAYTGESNPDRIYGFRILNVDVKWKVATGLALVTDISPVD
ncbi:MAG: tRNA (N6-threonylcarbamoyladenosine(37)-N6)-methyltransferase TrmO [Desulfobacterales bacterium]|nr:tRNA (N6-threonylcarbamoyladenosine(37)-N6)-methyltransferase TrmO [Desulfobacterales bacterium]